MNVHESDGGRAFEYIDDWANIYIKASNADVKDLTWQGVPIRSRQAREFSRYDFSTATTIKPENPGYHAPTPTHPPAESLLDRLGGSMSRLGVRETAAPAMTARGTGVSHIPVRPTETYKPPVPRREGVDTSFPGFPRPGMGESAPYYEAPAHRPDPIHRPPRPRRFETKRVRPSQLQKLCKAFDGSGDPYDHVARFRQVLYAEGVEDVHTMVQGFGLTFEGKALSWFQSLDNSVLYDFETLVAAFIKENTKTGIKHNTLTQILDFKQGEKESVKDAIVRLKRLISRCPPREMPAEDRLISCFLESLRDRRLHTQLFGQKHRTLGECFDDALLYADNCDLGGMSNNVESRDGSSHTSPHENSEAVADIVLRRLRQEG